MVAGQFHLHLSITSNTRGCKVGMGVLNWVQNRMYRTQQSKRKAGFIAGSARFAETSIGLHQTCEPDDCWSTAMLSIGTFETREGRRLKSLDGFNESCTVGVDELKKLQEELRLLMRGRGVTTAQETNRPQHLHLERLLNCNSHSQNGGDIVRSRSIRKPLRSAFNGFMPRPSFREPISEARLNEIIWGSFHKTALPENSALSEHVIRDDDRVVRMPQKVKVGVHEERGKWIRTDSEYIVLEI